MRQDGPVGDAVQPERGVDAQAQIGRQRLARKLFAERLPQRLDARALGGERRIACDLPFDRERIGRIELAVEVGVNQQHGVVVRSGGSCRSWLVRSKRRDQAAACARQPGHHGADRHLGDLRDLAVVETLNVTQHQRLAELIRQRRDRGFEPGGVGLGDQFGLGVAEFASTSPLPCACFCSTASRSLTATMVGRRFLPSHE